MGSRSSNSNDQNITNNDKRVAVSSGLGVSGDNNQISVVDPGAINAARDTMLAALAEIGKTSKTALDSNIRVVEGSHALAGTALHASQQMNATAVQQVASAYKNATEAAKGTGLGDYKWVLLGVCGVFALMAFKRG